VTSLAASGWSNSYRVGYLPPTGVTRPFHGAPRILVKNPETGRNAAFQAGSSCKTSKETLVLDFCSLF